VTPLDELNALFGDITIDLNESRKKASAAPTALRAKPAPKRPGADGEKAPPSSPSPTPLPPQRNPAFTPTLFIFEVVHQRCTTCGAEHAFVRSRRVRFESSKVAVEVPTVTLERLPRRVDHFYEQTELCPTCVCLAREIDDFLAFSAARQLELFHA
jgi:hypothetical protein